MVCYNQPFVSGLADSLENATGIVSISAVHQWDIRQWLSQELMGGHTAGPMLSLHACHPSLSIPGLIVPALEWLRRGGCPTSTGESPILPTAPQAPRNLPSDGSKGRAGYTTASTAAQASPVLAHIFATY